MTVIFLLLSATLLVVNPWGKDLTADIDNVGVQLVAALVATIASVHVLWRSVGRNRLGWMFIAFGCASWTAGQIAYCYYEIIRGVPAPYPSIADFGFDGAPFWFCAGIATWFSSRKGARVRIICDGLIVATAAIELVLVAVLQGKFNVSGDILRSVVSVVYPVGESIALTMAILLLIDSGRSQRISSLLLAGAFMALAFADLSYDYMQLLGTYRTGVMADLGWPVCFCLIMLASRHRVDMAAETAATEIVSSWRSIVTGMPLVVAVVVIAWHVKAENITQIEWVFLCILVSLTMIRQLLTTFENDALTRSLALSRDDLRQNEVQYRSVVETIDEVVFRVDKSGRILFLNEAWNRLTGYTVAETQGHVMLDYIPAEHEELAMSRFFNPGPTEGAIQPIQLMTQQGEVRLVELLSKPADDIDPPGFIGSMKDVTLRSKLESDLRIAHKLESVGRLAAGVAHEINTPIQVICDNLQFLTDVCEPLLRWACASRNLPSEQDAEVLRQAVVDMIEALNEVDVDFLQEEVPMALEDAFANAHSAARVIQAMLLSVSPGEERQRPLDINAMLTDVIAMLQNDIDDSTRTVFDFGDMMPVSCDGAAITSVFINVMRNAIQAINDGGNDGVISVKTRQVGKNALISVTDNGIGIPFEAQDRVFDPFFTTRQVGAGAGLGLSIASSTLLAHDGRIWLESIPQEGTSVYIELPMLGTLKDASMPAILTAFGV